MIKFILIALFLSIWHSILFFHHEMGLSVVLFVLPLLLFIIYVLKKEDKIENKYGLLLSIPIILLSCTYFVYDNWFFRTFNLVIIPLLFFLMYIITMKKKYFLLDLVRDSFSFVLMPVTSMFEITEIIGDSLFKKVKLSECLKSKIKSFLIILPIVLVVLWLLASADMIFSGIFDYLFDGMSLFLVDFLSEDFIRRIILIAVIFFVISGTVYYLVNDYLKFTRLDVDDFRKEKKQKNVDAIKMLFIILNIIYVVFDFIQIKSLMFHSVSSDIHYAEYARQGFFQLMIVSVINLTLILISKKYMLVSDKEQSRFFKIMSFIMIGLTIVIIISSFLRMNLYEQQYGYTLLRLLVYVSLITEIMLMIPTIIYIVKDNYNIIISYMVIILIVYIGLNYMNVDKIIAVRNIDRYYDKEDIDLDYLENENADNLGVLVDFYKEVKDEEIKERLGIYFKYLDIEMDNWQEYNISKDKGRELLRGYR